MRFTEARCMRMTSRNGSRFWYQPGQAPPVMATSCSLSPAASDRRAEFGDARRLQVSFAAHDGRHAGGIVAAGFGVVGQAGSHEQRAEIGVAQSERAEVVRVAGDGLGGIAGVVDQNLLRGDKNVDRMAVGRHVEGAVGRELHQVQRGQVAGRVVEEHVLRAGIARR